MFQQFRWTLALAVGALLLGGQTASAQRLLMEGFESYKLGSLDFNDPAGPNQSTNGDLTGNPWFGPEISSPNCQVVGPENGIQPHGGNQMIRGRTPTSADFDQDWFNLAYRLNNGQPFAEYIILSWWFYDPLGPGGTAFKDYVALGYYDTAPPDTDAPPNFNLNVGFTKIQRLSLGAPTANDPMFDPNYYQARVVGATDGYGAGYFNTKTKRSVGWHHGMIVVGAMQADGTNPVDFYIDDPSAPTFSHNSVTNYGYNVIEVNASFGAQTGYFDDIEFADFSALIGPDDAVSFVTPTTPDSPQKSEWGVPQMVAYLPSTRRSRNGFHQL